MATFSPLPELSAIACSSGFLCSVQRILTGKVNQLPAGFDAGGLSGTEDSRLFHKLTRTTSITKTVDTGVLLEPGNQTAGQCG